MSRDWPTERWRSRISLRPTRWTYDRARGSSDAMAAEELKHVRYSVTASFGGSSMKNGLRCFDSDMHVYDAADLYEKHMNPKWGERIPRGRRDGRHGRVEFKLGGGETLRGITEVIDHGQKQVADRYDFAVARGYDPVSQLEAMDREGLDVAVLFRTSPLHCDETLEPEYASDLCRAWNDWIADFCKANPERLKASALITLHDVDLAVAEVRRVAGALGIRALSLCPEPINGRRIH